VERGRLGAEVDVIFVDGRAVDGWTDGRVAVEALDVRDSRAELMIVDVVLGLRCRVEGSGFDLDSDTAGFALAKLAGVGRIFGARGGTSVVLVIFGLC